MFENWCHNLCYRSFWIFYFSCTCNTPCANLNLRALQDLTKGILQTTTSYSESWHIHWDETKIKYLTEWVWDLLLGRRPLTVHIHEIQFCSVISIIEVVQHSSLTWMQMWRFYCILFWLKRHPFAMPVTQKFFFVLTPILPHFLPAQLAYIFHMFFNSLERNCCSRTCHNDSLLRQFRKKCSKWAY